MIILRSSHFLPTLSLLWPIFLSASTMCLDHLEATYLGAVYMSRASPANRADLSHENL